MIYILYHYGEHGAEKLLATTDAANLSMMFDKVVEHPELANMKQFGFGYPEAKAAMIAALASGKQGRFNLQEGHGGLVLHISEDFQ